MYSNKAPKPVPAPGCDACRRLATRVAELEELHGIAMRAAQHNYEVAEQYKNDRDRLAKELQGNNDHEDDGN